jgi:gamma-glutamylcysteine synthetase
MSEQEKSSNQESGAKYVNKDHGRVLQMGDNPKLTASTINLGDQQTAELTMVLQQLAAELSKRAQTIDQKEDAHRVEEAVEATKKGHQAEANDWLRRLSGAGKWVIDVAKETGAKVAAELIDVADGSHKLTLHRSRPYLAYDAQDQRGSTI